MTLFRGLMQAQNGRLGIKAVENPAILSLAFETMISPFTALEGHED
jgi:hypothetical protein